MVVAVITTTLVFALAINAGYMYNAVNMSGDNTANEAFQCAYSLNSIESVIAKNKADGNYNETIQTSSSLTYYQLYYVAIPEENIIFPIQDADNMEFIPPSAISIVYVGTLPQIRLWEIEKNRPTITPHCNYLFYMQNIFAVVYLYNSEGIVDDKLLRWVPHDFEPDEISTLYVKTWEQILAYDIIDIIGLHPRSTPPVGDNQHFVLVETGNSIRLIPIQCPHDWGFVRPDRVEFSIEEILCQSAPNVCVLLICLFDNQCNLLGQYRVYGHQAGPRTPYYTMLMIGTLYEIYVNYGV